MVELVLLLVELVVVLVELVVVVVELQRSVREGHWRAVQRAAVTGRTG